MTDPNKPHKLTADEAVSMGMKVKIYSDRRNVYTAVSAQSYLDAVSAREDAFFEERALRRERKRAGEGTSGEPAVGPLGRNSADQAGSENLAGPTSREREL